MLKEIALPVFGEFLNGFVIRIGCKRFTVIIKGAVVEGDIHVLREAVDGAIDHRDRLATRDYQRNLVLSSMYIRKTSKDSDIMQAG